MPPSIDYRIDILLTLVRMRIHTLKDFYSEGEAHFSADFDELTAKTDRLPMAEWEQLEDYYMGERDELRSLRQLKRHFATAGLFNVFETFLRETLDLLGRAGVYVPDPEDGKHRDLDNMKKAFRGIRVPITKPDADWKAIKKLQAIRNCITHCDGVPDEEYVQKLKGYNVDVPPHVWMELLDGYFEESADLVERVCDRIVNDCHREFPSR